MNNYLVNKMTEYQARMVAAVTKYDGVMIWVNDKEPLEIKFKFTELSTADLVGSQVDQLATFNYNPRTVTYQIYWDGVVCNGMGENVDYVLDNFIKLTLAYRIKRNYEHDMKLLGIIPLDGGD